MTNQIEAKVAGDRSPLIVMELAYCFYRYTGIEASRPVSPTGEHLARCCLIESKNDV